MRTTHVIVYVTVYPVRGGYVVYNFFVNQYKRFVAVCFVLCNPPGEFKERCNCHFYQDTYTVRYTRINAGTAQYTRIKVTVLLQKEIDTYKFTFSILFVCVNNINIHNYRKGLLPVSITGFNIYKF